MNAHPPTYGIYDTLFPTNFPIAVPQETADARGRLFRGIVFAVHNFDEQSPQVSPYGSPVAIYCDVLVYSNRPNRRTFLLPNCLVTQESSSLHDGKIWRPRAVTRKFNGTLDPNQLRSLDDLDGDHVLVGFVDGDAGLPVILRQLPHPSTINKTRLPAAVDKLGHRTTPRSSDPEVLFWRHHGTFFGLQEDGTFVVDASRGHAGTIDAAGDEEPYANATAPNTVVRLREGGKLLVEIVTDADNPDAPPKKIELQVNKDGLMLSREGANTLTLAQSGAGATAQVGDGAKHVAIVEHLQALYDELKSKLDAFDLRFASHTHATTFGPSDVPIPGAGIGAPSWDPNIASTKVSLPDG